MDNVGQKSTETNHVKKNISCSSKDLEKRSVENTKNFRNNTNLDNQGSIMFPPPDVELYTLRFMRSIGYNNLRSVVNEIWSEKSGLSAEERRQITRNIALEDWGFTYHHRHLWMYKATIDAVITLIRKDKDYSVMDSLMLEIVEMGNYPARDTVLRFYPRMEEIEEAIPILESILKSSRDYGLLGGSKDVLRDLYSKYSPEKLLLLNFNTAEYADPDTIP